MSIKTKGKIGEGKVKEKGLVWMVVVGNKPSGKGSPGGILEAFISLGRNSHPPATVSECHKTSKKIKKSYKKGCPSSSRLLLVLAPATSSPSRLLIALVLAPHSHLPRWQPRPPPRPCSRRCPLPCRGALGFRRGVRGAPAKP